MSNQAKVNIEVDVVGQIRLFRTATFPSKYPIIKEAIQNGQRSKGVTLMDFWVSSDKIVIMDNGEGLRDPKDLLTIAKSGWDEEIQKDENPFGLGFFSCVKLADLITVESNNFRLVLDVPKILRGDTAIDIQELEEPVKGFRLIIEKPLKSFSTWDIERTIKDVGRYITKFDIRINESKIETKSFTQPDDTKFARSIQGTLFEGWIRPYHWLEDHSSEFGSNQGIRIFYQDRLVRTLSLGLDIAGSLLVYNHCIDLRAPDREDIIDNDKLGRLKNEIKEYVKNMLFDILEKGSERDLDKYSDLINSILTPREYSRYMKYMMVQLEEGLNKLIGMTVEERNKLSEDELKHILEKPIDKKQSPDTLNIETSSNNIPQPRISSQGHKKEDRDELPQRDGFKLPEIGTHQMIYYLHFKELLSYVEIIRTALQNKIPIIIIRNKLEEKAIRIREDIIHVSELEQKTRWSAKLAKVGPKDAIEDRAVWLFEIVSRVMGLEQNPFEIGDLTATKRVTLGPIEIEKEEHSPFGLASGQQILIDRGKLYKSGLVPSNENKILISDLMFLGANIDTIAHELTHIIYDTEDETMVHFGLQLEVTRELTEKLFSIDLEV